MFQTAHFKCKKAVNLSTGGDSSNMNAKLGTSGSTLKKMSSDICYGKLEKPLSLINSKKNSSITQRKVLQKLILRFKHLAVKKGIKHLMLLIKFVWSYTSLSL
jgi:hypothetical protein